MKFQRFALFPLITLATLSGCDLDLLGTDQGTTGRTKPPPFSKTLVASPGSGSGVIGLSWGGPGSGRLLGALRADGRVDLYHPAEKVEPVTTAVDLQEKATSLAILGGGKFVTGNDSGLVAWSVDPRGCRRLGQIDRSAVTCLAAATGESDEGYAGLRDGTVLRFRVMMGEEPIRVMAEHRPEGDKPSPVASLAIIEEGKAIFVSWSDGHFLRLRRDLSPGMTGVFSGVVLAEVQEGRLRARLLPGPSLVVEDLLGRDPVRRLALGRRATSLAFTGRSQGLVVGGDGQFLVIDLTPAGPIAPESPRILAVAAGPAFVVADPDGTAGRVAIADASGRIEVADAEALASRGALRPTDEVPELAFVPWKRLKRPRTEVASAPEPKLPETAAIDPTHPEALDQLRAAIETFARAGRVDREADMRRWLGRALIPDFDGSEPVRDIKRILEGIDQLAKAAKLYESAQPPLPRQARICDVERAWALLTLGDCRNAEAVLQTALDFAKSDPVLDQAPEIDAVAGAAAASRGDWGVAGDRFDHALNRLFAGERDGLRRRVELSRIGSYTIFGKLREAADLAERDGGTDPEIRLRGLTAKIRIGQPVAPFAIAGAKDAHIRGRIGAAEGRFAEADSDLGDAIEAYRRAGRNPLMLEATLERAEALESRGVYREAQAFYESIVRSPPPAADRSAVAAVPLGLVRPRADRGLARCLLAAGKPESALMTIEQGAWNAWVAESSEAAVRSSPMALPADAAGALAELRKLRAEAGPESNRARELEAKLAIEGRLLAPSDPTAPFDPASLRLVETEAVVVFANLGPESIVAFLMQGSHPIEAHLLPLSRSELRKAISAWRSSLGDGGRGMIASEDVPGLGLLTTLSPEPGPTAPAVTDLKPLGPSWDAYLDDALVRPFLPRLERVTRLIVVPTDEIAALPMEAVGRASRLLSKLRVSYIPSLSALQARRDEARLILGTGAVALWLSAPEAQARATAAGAQAIAVSGDEARPSRLFGLALADCGVVRLSAPATLDPRKTPWGQADLRLAPDTRIPWTDGRLTATDILRLPLRARLLMLDLGDPSARDDFSGRGIHSLVRAGLAAGAEAVLVSLWDVPPASSIAFFNQFQQALSEGKSPSDALDRARRALAANPKTKDPVHWAGFVLYGAP